MLLARSHQASAWWQKGPLPLLQTWQGAHRNCQWWFLHERFCRRIGQCIIGCLEIFQGSWSMCWTYSTAKRSTFSSRMASVTTYLRRACHHRSGWCWHRYASSRQIFEEDNPQGVVTELIGVHLTAQRVGDVRKGWFKIFFCSSQQQHARWRRGRQRYHEGTRERMSRSHRRVR